MGWGGVHVVWMSVCVDECVRVGGACVCVFGVWWVWVGVRVLHVGVRVGVCMCVYCVVCIVLSQTFLSIRP